MGAPAPAGADAPDAGQCSTGHGRCIQQPGVPNRQPGRCRPPSHETVAPVSTQPERPTSSDADDCTTHCLPLIHVEDVCINKLHSSSQLKKRQVRRGFASQSGQQGPEECEGVTAQRPASKLKHSREVECNRGNMLFFLRTGRNLIRAHT